MTTLLAAFSSTSTSALACRDALGALRTAYSHLATCCTQEIQQVARVIEGLPPSATVGQHCGAVGSAMAVVHEATRTARTQLTMHMLELEFVSHEATTLAQGVGGLAESFPLPAMAPVIDRNRPQEHVCDKCKQPTEPFSVCPCCDPSNADESEMQLVRALAKSFPLPATAPDESELSQGEAEHLSGIVTSADIQSLHNDIDAGIAKPSTTTAEERSRKLDQELAAAQADLDRLPSSIGVSGLNDPSNQAALARLDATWEQEATATAANPPATPAVAQPKKPARKRKAK